MGASMVDPAIAKGNEPDLEDLADLGFVAASEALADTVARPVPRVSIQAFCETSDVATAVQAAADDRRFSKAHVGLHLGGCAAAVQHFESNPTPNLIIVENTGQRDKLLSDLDKLAEHCDAGTKVVVIGHMNDVTVYRELLKRGVGEYLVAPVTAAQIMESVSNLYNDPQADPVGVIHAYIGAKGGAGSSTICHNTAWSMSEVLKANVVVADLDLAFGTTGLDFNQDPLQGIGDALATPERLDEVLLDRLLTKCSEHLSIFAAPVTLERGYEVSPESCETVLDVVRQNVPFVAIDLPHAWTSWTKNVLLQADEVVITAVPDLANLRNAKNIIDLLRQARRNDRPPLLVLNTVNMPKRPEIAVKEFEAALNLKASAVIDFDIETFGQAANNGQMIAETNAKAKAVPALRQLALVLARKEERPDKKGGLAPLLERLRLKR
jgi:pilus assembly protein CpaE